MSPGPIAALPSPGPAAAPSHGAGFGAALRAAGAGPAPAPPGPSPAASAAAAASPRAAAPAPGAGAPGSATAAARETLRSIERAQARLDGVLEAARRGRTFTAPELLALQVEAYRCAQTLDVASKAVEHAAQSVKQAVNTQV